MAGASERPDDPLPRERAASLRRIPSLDGLRAVSILMVLGLHTIQRVETQHPVSPLWGVLFNGSLGVSIFFVISGYLITRLLLHEAETRGHISLGGFYLKRAFRILPPLYAYVLVLVALAAAGRLSLTRSDVLSAMLFFHNYALDSHSWAIEHLWTLAVEEQFYLVWPLILIACLRFGPALGRRRAATVAIAVMLLSPAVRVLSSMADQPMIHHDFGFHMHADLLAFGCLGALLEGHARFERLVAVLSRSAAIPVAALALDSLLEVFVGNRWTFSLGRSFTGLFALVLLLWCVRNAGTAAGRLLNQPLVAHLGVLSYSIYIWQTLFLHRGNATVFRDLPYLGQLPVNLLATLLIAEFSLHCVERPSLALRNHVLGRSLPDSLPNRPAELFTPSRMR